MDKATVAEESRVKTISDLLVIVILAIFIASATNVIFFETVRVRGGSMNDTLYGGGDIEVDKNMTFWGKLIFGADDLNTMGDKVLLQKLGKIQAGDIIVFKAFNEDGLRLWDMDLRGNKTQTQWIKRVIGVGGDTVEIYGGRVFVNNKELVEPYLKTPNSTYIEEERLTVLVPEDCYFVMGDNRERGGSSDSRLSEVGCIKQENVVGKVLLVFGKKSHKLSTSDSVSGL